MRNITARFLLILAFASGAASAERLTLAKKADLLDYDMQRRFILEGQALCKLKLPTESRSFIAYNMPDNAYMSGMYVGALALQYATTNDDEAREAASATLDALDRLCTISGKPGLLARAFWPVDKPFDDDGIWRPSADGQYRWRGDVSSDQVDGVVFGYALAYEFVANDEEKAVIARNVAAITDHILRNDLRIVGYDGEPTQWGKYYPEYVREREPMNALLFLQLLKVAAYITGDSKYEDLYREYAVDKNYAEIAVGARVLADPERVNHSDDVLIFLAYYPLLRLEKDPELRERYLESLRRAWNGNDQWPGVAPEANPLYAYIARYGLGEEIPVESGTETLRMFPLDMKWNSGTIEGYEKSFSFDFDLEPVSSPAAPGEPIPIDRRRKSWSAWVMNPYTTAGSRNDAHPMEYNGHDYLLAYWLGRRHGFIKADE